MKSIERIKGGLNGKDKERIIDNFRLKLLGRRIALGLCQMGFSKLGNYKNQAEKWSAIYSLLITGQADKYRKANEVDSFMSRHLFGMSKKINYDWNRAALLVLTPKERNWLDINGEKIANHKI